VIDLHYLTDLTPAKNFEVRFYAFSKKGLSPKDIHLRGAANELTEIVIGLFVIRLGHSRPSFLGPKKS
jgi:hypothetical protein